jgi:hypothetical protein
MDYYVDTASTTGFVNWANVAPFEPERRERQRSPLSNEVFTPISGAPNFFDAVSGPLAPTAKLSRNPPKESFTPIASEAKEIHPQNLVENSGGKTTEINNLAKQRVRLMAARYASGVESSEMVARLEILNRRLLEKSPRVSTAQIQALEDAAGELARARQVREERRKRLGIGV